jgi:hypothetical protein
MPEEQVDEPISRVVNPMVFISHDTRDADLAEAFSNLLKSVSAGVLKSFRTSDRKGNQGIEYGVEWYPEIIRNIQGASDVVCLLTKRSVDRPWLLFEAGMAKGKLDTPILGVALGIELKDASSGPFAQFQNCGDDEKSLTKLVFQLVNRIPNSEPDQETINFQVGKFKKSIQEILEKLESSESKKTTNDLPLDVKEIENSSAKLFEEIKIMFQDLPSRIDRRGVLETKRLRRGLHPSMVLDLIYQTKEPRLGVRIALSLFREKLPWIYDEGILLVGKLEQTKSPAMAAKIFRELEILLKTCRHPVLEEMMQDKEDAFILHEVPILILKMMSRYPH